MVRDTVVAGQFYAADRNQLEGQIKDSFLSRFGPGDLPLSKRTKKVLGAIAPHAGYAFSGPCAAWAYKEIAEAEFPDVFIMLGTNHSALRTVASDEDWKTPLGTLKTDKEFLKAIDVQVDNQAHDREHSIEVQLPFLQYANAAEKDKIRIVCLMVSGDVTAKEFGKKLKETIAKSKKKVCIIASSDFTHYGPNYGYTPFAYNVKEQMKELDLKAINAITKLDSGAFLNLINKTQATICGSMPIAVLIETLKDRCKKAKLLHYYTSADMMGDYTNAVGYGSIVFYE